jgi:cellulose biosynthesis protein BcsQ
VPSSARRPRRGVRLSVFNHKGGVGKTTLTMNLAATLAKAGQRVLLVDTDPQCNLTSYLIEDEVVDDLLDKADSPQGQTIWSAVQPVAEALGGFKPVRPLETGVTNLFLLPGDIRLSEYETDLAEFWAQCLQRKPKGFRGTTAVSELVGSIVESLKIDYVFFDSGPNIGPLNRTLLLDCDYFIVPVACDLFSLRALKTLGRTLTSWITDWSTIADLAPDGTYLLPGRPRFLGYVPGGFRVYGGAIASQHSHYLSQIEREIHSQIVVLLRKIDPELASGSLSQFKLGEVQDFGSLVPASQREGLPLYAVHAGTPAQRQGAKAAFESVSKRVQSRIAAQS